MSEPTMKIEELIELLTSGRVDVLECQRPFQRDARWVAKLIGSTVADCPWGAVLFWVPDDSNRPLGGRYQQDTAADYFVIDGGQRLTALVAALGKQPPWIPEDEWVAMDGPSLAVSVGLTRNDDVRMRPTSSSAQGDIPLGELLSGTPIEDLLDRAGLAQRKGLIQKLADVASEIKNFEVHVEWIKGTEEHAEQCFLRRNEKSQQMALKTEQFQISVLTCRFRPLQRDITGPLLRHAEARNMGKVVNLRSVNQIIQHLLPPEFRGGRAVHAEPSQVEEVARLAAGSITHALDYLERIGIVHEDLLPFPSMIEVMAGLIARYPAEAMTDTFLAHWLTHVIAAEVFHGAKTVRHLLKELENSTSYQEAKVTLSRIAPEGRPSPFTHERVIFVEKGRFGSTGCLYVLAAAAKTSGLVVDLDDTSGIVFPHPSMTLRPLTDDPIKGYMPHYGLLTEAMANKVQEGRGWTRQTYEMLLPSTQVLHVHQLEEPPPGLGHDDVPDFLALTRRKPIADVIDSYLRTIPPLPGREGPAQGDLFRQEGGW
ncbi:hypothetical protein F4560_008640 [Saccharothrix ecbatanensis]|uniref:GmrSD restriction endonucleases N-terminal domain-containing protein n=1 Tax=Saccharothrix ecbatanensis TaxID=1105145 RepID=A0A7W9M640_9PSEU|nr:DUF262 domain-containing protein [Saccharothrix ecbatanensis]MBB5808872.1 hypothetical protein [Saccharothrix ecbatanensis]